MPSPTLIAIVGAESTGKTTLARMLARSLAERLPAPAGALAPRIAWVPEWLREWCDAQGRVPRADEQAAIAQMQHERIRNAARTHDIVICDTTSLMTAVYSRLLFNDRSLEGMAAQLHREMSLTLLTALGLPWVSDGHQRDGPHVREPVDDLLRELLHAHKLPYAVVAGREGQRLAQAEAAVQWALHATHTADATAPSTPAASGAPGRPPRPLFSHLVSHSSHLSSHLSSHPAESPTTAARRWVCDCCVPAAEQVLLARQRETPMRRKGSRNTA